MKRLFNGSTESLMLNLFEMQDLEEAEIKRLRKLLNQKLKEQQS